VVVTSHGELAVLNGGEIRSSTFAQGQAGSVVVTADRSLTVDRQGSEFFTGITSSATSGSEGDAGSVVVTSHGELAVLNGGAISSSTFAQGQAGSVVVTADRSLTVDRQGSEFVTGITSDADSGSEGDAGNVVVTSHGELAVVNGGAISGSTFAQGRGGTVTVQALGKLTLQGNGSRITARASQSSTGRTGDVKVVAGDELNLSDHAKISIENAGHLPDAMPSESHGLAVTAPVVKLDGADTQITAVTLGNANAGSILVNVAKFLAITQGAAITSATSGAGGAGDVMVHAGVLTIDGGGLISAEAQAESGGQTGRVTVTASDSMRLTHAAKISLANAGQVSDPGQIQAGQIQISTPRLELNHSQITTQADGNLDAGRIELDVAETLSLADTSFIRTTANTGHGGDIVVSVLGGDPLSLRDSGIETSVRGPGGDGGEIGLQAPTLLLETGMIQANAVSGRGGDIQLNVQTLMPSGNQINGQELGGGDPFSAGQRAGEWASDQFGNNVIQAVSQTGVSGTTTLSTPQLNLSGALANLGNPVLDTSRLEADYCALGLGSSLILEGHGGLLPRGDDLMVY
jgi:large exoprotein involved in heme utilization and adhesion